MGVLTIKHFLQTLTSGPRHHFFGYYGICPWNGSEDRLLCLESAFQDRLPKPDESAVIGLVNAKTGTFSGVAETRAWNLQQGAMLHWHPRAPDTEIIYNDHVDNTFVSTVLNVYSGQKRFLPRPVSAVDREGMHALSLSYGRLQRLRKVVGYPGAVDPNPDDPHPDNDGVFLLDLHSGHSELVVAIAQVYERLADAHPYLKDRHLWFNHAVFNKSGNRFFFLARCWEGDALQTGMFTADLDGGALREVVPFGKRVSHFDWRDDTHILATFDVRGRRREHVLVEDGTGEMQLPTGGQLDFDGHPSFSPDGRWLVTDRNDTDHTRKELLLAHPRDEQVEVLTRFDMLEPRFMTGDVRCDLHPRWNRSGTAVCVDALEPVGGSRQLHIVHLEFDNER